MDGTTCKTPECDKPTHARGLCMACYGRVYRSDDFKLLVRAEQHRITEVDPVAKTGMCSICGLVPVRIRTNGRGSECKIKRRLDRAKTRRHRPQSARMSKYGLTRDQLVALEVQADGRCLICHKEFAEDGYAVDHCHETGVVRGLLCRRCNFALGWLEDDPERVLSAYFYLLSGGRAIAG